MSEAKRTLEDRRQLVEYIERMSLELSRLANEAELSVLSYLLDMAAEEAASIRSGPPPMPARPRSAEPGRTPRTRGRLDVSR